MALRPGEPGDSESNMPLDDHELLAEWSRTRYERAFRTLVDRRLPLVFATAFRITQHPGRAGQVAEGTFVRLASQPPRLAAGQSLSAWLHASTRAVAGERDGSGDAPPEDPPTETHGANNEPPADWSQMAPVIDELIDALPAADREPLMLRLIEGCSYEEVGERLGLAEQAARQRIGKALEKLRQLLGERGIATSAAALATLLPAHAALAPPPELAPAIVDAAIAAPFVAAPSDRPALLKRCAVAAAAVGLVGIAVKQQATIAALNDEAATVAPAAAEGTRRTASAHTAAAREVSASAPAGLAGRALVLARMNDPLARDAALAEWSARFATTAEIQQVLAALRADPAGTPALRAAIAPHLTRQWVAIDAPACIATLLSDGALYHRDPFDSNNNPLAGEGDAATSRVSLFRLVAETAPAAWDAWLKTAPPDLIPALLGDRASPTFAAWAMNEGLDDAALDRIGRPQAGDLSSGENLLSGDFAEVMIRRAPELLLRPAVEGHDLAADHRYYSAVVARFGGDDGFADALLECFAPASLWEVFGRVEGAYQAEVAEGFVKLARLELAVRGRPPAQAAAAILAMPPGFRQAATLTALLDALKPGEAGYWDGLSTVAKTVDAASPGADALAGAFETAFYTTLRTRLAVRFAQEDVNAALAWAGSIRSELVRIGCLAAIAAKDLRPDIRAWAVSAADDARVMVVRCEGPSGGSAVPALLSEFELPEVQGETVPQTYARIRRVLDEQLQKAGLQTNSAPAAPVAPTPPSEEPQPVPNESEPAPLEPAPDDGSFDANGP